MPSGLPPFGDDLTRRFAPLFHAAGQAPPSGKQPALRPEATEKSQLQVIGVAAGRDVELALVMAPRQADGKARPCSETLTYRQDVAGTDLVYDLTGEFLQGKARPFVCDLTKLPVRLYALLPFQVENLTVRAQQKISVAKGKGITAKFEVEFQDGQGKRVQGSLPCHARLLQPDGKPAWEQYLATAKDGSLSAAAELPTDAQPGEWSLAVRSQLTGDEATLRIEVH